MQRQGRKGLAHYRIIVQDSRLTPTSGRIVAQVGSYNPHTKEIALDKETAQKFLDNGAQPSPRVVLVLEKEGVKLPKWVQKDAPKAKTTRNSDKLRKNQPKEEAKPIEEAPIEEPAAEVAEEPVVEETPAVEAEVEETTEAAETPATTEAEAPLKTDEEPAETSAE